MERGDLGASLRGQLSLEGSPATVHRALVEGGRVSLDDPLASTLVTMAFDLYPEVVHSGGKVAVQQQYRAYHQIVTWIFEGAEP